MANFERPFTPRGWLRLARNFAKTHAFQMIPYVSFPRQKQIFLKPLNGRLPLEDGSDRPETLGKRVSVGSRHFIFRRRKNFSFQRQNVKCRGSPETRFGQVSGQSEPSSWGKRPFKVCDFFNFVRFGFSVFFGPPRVVGGWKFDRK